jgi:hypothetical protein
LNTIPPLFDLKPEDLRMLGYILEGYLKEKWDLLPNYEKAGNSRTSYQSHLDCVNTPSSTLLTFDAFVEHSVSPS